MGWQTVPAGVNKLARPQSGCIYPGAVTQQLGYGLAVTAPTSLIATNAPLTVPRNGQGAVRGLGPLTFPHPSHSGPEGVTLNVTTMNTQVPVNGRNPMLTGTPLLTL